VRRTKNALWWIASAVAAAFLWYFLNSGDSDRPHSESRNK
jgi:hypothetical protein